MDDSTNLNEDEGLRLLRDQPDIAMELFYRRYAKRVEYFIRSFIKNDDVKVEEIFSAVLELMLKKADDIAVAHNPYWWIMSATKNLVYAELRKGKHFVKLDLEEAANIGGGEEADAILRFKEGNEEIVRVMSSLTNRERDAWIDNKLNGLTVSEIAKRYKINIQSVKNVLSSATRKVRDLFRW